MSQDLVSVIMPSYNTEKYILDSIQSVQAQTYANWELIIVDDCSTDNTVEIVKKHIKTCAKANGNVAVCSKCKTPCPE